MHCSSQKEIQLLQDSNLHKPYQLGLSFSSFTFVLKIPWLSGTAFGTTRQVLGSIPSGIIYTTHHCYSVKSHNMIFQTRSKNALIFKPTPKTKVTSFNMIVPLAHFEARKATFWEKKKKLNTPKKPTSRPSF